MELSVPLAVDVNTGRNWGSLTRYEWREELTAIS
jgi:hypothetical protein